MGFVKGTKHDKVATTSTTTSTTTTIMIQPPDQEPPKPMPMAIMRNAHEVIRGAMLEIKTALDAAVSSNNSNNNSNNLDFEAICALFQDLDRYQGLHMRMEEGCGTRDSSSSSDSNSNNYQGLFALMDDKADDAATKAGLRDHHSQLNALESQVRVALSSSVEEGGNLADAQRLFPHFRTANEAHLVIEEQVLMPAVLAMKQAGVPLKKHIRTDLLPALLLGPLGDSSSSDSSGSAEDDDTRSDLQFFLQFSCTTLEAYELTLSLSLAKGGNTTKQQQQQPKTRVFCMACWAIATPTEWIQWNRWIQQALTHQKYKQVARAIHSYELEQNSAWC